MSIASEKANLWNKAHRDRTRLNYQKWYAKNGRKRKDDYKEIIYEWRQEHPDRVLVSRELRKMVILGKVVKPKLCENCKKEKKLSGHHEDYSKPLQVIWLCASCHKLRHGIGKI